MSSRTAMALKEGTWKAWPCACHSGTRPQFAPGMEGTLPSSLEQLWHLDILSQEGRALEPSQLYAILPQLHVVIWSEEAMVLEPWFSTWVLSDPSTGSLIGYLHYDSLR